MKPRVIRWICLMLLCSACDSRRIDLATPIRVGEPARMPNVVQISIDTLRADHLGSHGYRRPTSPRLDAFARTAVRFSRAYAQSPWTTPSHWSMLTGLYPSGHRVNQSFTDLARFLGGRGCYRLLSPRVETLAELLRREGYRTLARTVSETDIVTFVNLCGFTEPLFVDMEYVAKESVYGLYLEVTFHRRNQHADTLQTRPPCPANRCDPCLGRLRQRHRWQGLLARPDTGGAGGADGGGGIGARGEH